MKNNCKMLKYKTVRLKKIGRNFFLGPRSGEDFIYRTPKA